MQTFAERIKKVRLGGPQVLSILEHYGDLFEVLKRYTGNEELKQKVEEMEGVWK